MADEKTQKPKQKTEFLLAAGALVVAAVMVFTGHLDPEQWTQMAQTLGLGYAGARTLVKGVSSVSEGMTARRNGVSA